MNKALLAAAAFSAAIAAVPATAQQPAMRPLAQTTATTLAPQRGVFVCDDSAETRTAFARRYGQVRYVTAEEITTAAALGETWATPRCITDVELRRYRALISTTPVTVASGR